MTRAKAKNSRQPPKTPKKTGIVQPLKSLKNSLARPVLDELSHELQELGLSPYEARVLLALLRLGSANSADLARVVGIPRTSTYGILEQLREKGLAERMPCDGPAVWVSSGRQTVLERLSHSQEQRLKEQGDRIKRLGNMLAEAVPKTDPKAAPFFQILPKSDLVKKIFDELCGATSREVLALSQPPYAGYSDDVSPVLIDALARNVQIRAVFEEPVVDDPGSEASRSKIAAYMKAGVDLRVLDELPLKMVILDRKVVLLGVGDPQNRGLGHSVNLLIEHRGLAELQAEAFETVWKTARPPIR